MRNSLLTITLLSALITACRSDQIVGPLDLLYRQWRLLRTREVTKSDWREQNRDAIYTVEYHADGTLIYRRNGVQTEASCCAPTKFNRQGVAVDYSDWQLCYNALCATVKRVIIDQITETQLELNDGYTVSQYESVN